MQDRPAGSYDRIGIDQCLVPLLELEMAERPVAAEERLEAACVIVGVVIIVLVVDVVKGASVCVDCSSALVSSSTLLLSLLLLLLLSETVRIGHAWHGNKTR